MFLYLLSIAQTSYKRSYTVTIMGLLLLQLNKKFMREIQFVIHIYNSCIFTIIEYAIDREQEILFIHSLMMNTGIICSSNFYGFTFVNILVSISWCTCTLATLVGYTQKCHCWVMESTCFQTFKIISNSFSSFMCNLCAYQQ